MRKREWKQFNLFKQEVLKYDSLYIEDLHMLIRRYTFDCNRKFTFFKSRNPILTTAKAKSSYYRFWIRMLEKQKILIPKKPFVWEVNNGFKKNI